jgi:hypothetical protein
MTWNMRPVSVVNAMAPADVALIETDRSGLFQKLPTYGLYALLPQTHDLRRMR